MPKPTKSQRPEAERKSAKAIRLAERIERAANRAALADVEREALASLASLAGADAVDLVNCLANHLHLHAEHRAMVACLFARIAGDALRIGKIVEPSSQRRETEPASR